MTTIVSGAERIAERVGDRTVASDFLATVDERGAVPALRWRDGENWEGWTWSDYADRVGHVAAGLRALGVERGERIAIMTRNRPEFHVVDLAALMIGAVPVSLYNSSAPDQIAYVVNHAAAAVAVVENPTFLERFLKIRDRLPGLRHIVIVSDPEQVAPPDVVTLDRLLAVAPVDLRTAADAVRPDDPATFIYTSGTTGPPKAVVITHRNVLWAMEGLIDALGHGVGGFRTISFLPMAHIAERLTTHYVHAYQGTEVTTCPDPALLPEYLREVRPQLFFAVPRVWEKARSSIAALAGANPDQQAVFESALEVGRDVAGIRAEGGELPAELARRWEEAEPVTGLVRGLMGLDQCEVAVTAAAPMPPDVLTFFRSLGLPLSELYGMSETTGTLTWDPRRPRVGDVGSPLPGCEIMLAPDGEILARGGSVFAGYHDDPDRTAAAFDADGWLRTGDLGVLEAGRLRIVGRKKDLIITAGGENVAPSNIESALQSCQLISQACVAGDGRPYLVALLTLDPDVLPVWAGDHDLAELSFTELTRHADVRAEIKREIGEVNRHLSRTEQIRRFAILDHEWAVDSDELTPTMKMRRERVLAKYAAEINALY